MSGSRAWGWVDHLLDGGTTAWTEWTGSAAPGGLVVPGAQQLELVRRLNLAGSPSPELVRRVLATSAPGRGQPDLELVGEVTPSPFGPRPVDPAALPDRELLRVAAAVLAEDVVDAPRRPRARGRRRPWRPRRAYRLAGDPELTSAARSWLVARGRPPGGRAPVVAVLATDLGRMLAHEWTARAFGSGVRAWGPWLARLARPGADLPPRVDVARVARDWAHRVGKHRVHVVVDPEALGDLVGVRRSPPFPTAPAVAVPDLARRVGVVVGLHVPPAERTRLMRDTFRAALAGTPGEPLVLPEEHRDWARARAERMIEAVSAAGYPVHGDLRGLLPGDLPGASAPRSAQTLALAVRTMLDAVLEEGA